MARFIYLNVSPQGERKNDCVTRAITLASGLSYSTVRKKLFHTSRLLGCMKLCWSCYSFLLTNVLGYRQVNCDDMTVEEFANTHQNGTYLIRIQSHLTCIKDGVLMDIWNCLSRECDLAWEIR